jgi:hypothetical protein
VFEGARAYVLERQQRLFGLDAALVALRIIDDTFIDPGRGVERGHNVLGFVVTAGVPLLAALSYGHLPAGLRVAISFRTPEAGYFPSPSVGPASLGRCGGRRPRAWDKESCEGLGVGQQAARTRLSGQCWSPSFGVI